MLKNRRPRTNSCGMSHDATVQFEEAPMMKSLLSQLYVQFSRTSFSLLIRRSYKCFGKALLHCRAKHLLMKKKA